MSVGRQRQVHQCIREKNVLLTELRMVEKILSLNIRVSMPNKIHHVDITNKTNLRDLKLIVYFILISPIISVCLSVHLFLFGHCSSLRLLNRNWQTMTMGRGGKLGSTRLQTRRRHGKLIIRLTSVSKLLMMQIYRVINFIDFLFGFLIMTLLQ